MLDQASSYILAWGAYIVSVLGIMAVAWRITRNWFGVLKTVTRLLVLACLLTPIDVGIDKNWYAPAHLVAIYEQVLGNSDVALKAISHIGIVLALLVAFSVLAWVIKKIFHFGGSVSSHNLKPDIKIGRYRHYKGKTYEVLSVARHSETEEWHVVYQALYGEFGVWIRPASLFEGSVEVSGQPMTRFVYVGKSL